MWMFKMANHHFFGSFSTLFCCCLWSVLMSFSPSAHTYKLMIQIHETAFNITFFHIKHPLNKTKLSAPKKSLQTDNNNFCSWLWFNQQSSASHQHSQWWFYIFFHFAAEKDRQSMFYWWTTLVIVYQSVAQFQERRAVAVHVNSRNQINQTNNVCLSSFVEYYRLSKRRLSITTTQIMSCIEGEARKTKQFFFFFW